MKINILSYGRFHVCDLARELSRCGHEVRFYSFVPKKRAMAFGLPAECSRSLVIPMLPFLILERKIFKKSRLMQRLSTWALDQLAALTMEKADVVIAMSGYVAALKRAKRMGAHVIVERGSKHILEQKAILEAIPTLKGAEPVPAANVRRDLEGYKLADHIAIASGHVKESFLKHGFEEAKLFVNPYGVNLGMFKPMAEVVKEYDLIMVGGWSYRKGCDLLVSALKDSGYRFLHVGGIVDIDFPVLPNFTHVEPVNEPDLVHYYAKAKVALLASREEGLAMVQAQALACGLPLVCSADSGGKDLGIQDAMKGRIFEMADLTERSLMVAIGDALRYRDNSSLSVGDLSQLTWEAYGRRYDAFLKQAIAW